MTATATMERLHARRHDDGAAALARIETHEEVCLVRYDTIISRIGKLEAALYWAAGGLLTGMAGVIATLLLKGH